MRQQGRDKRESRCLVLRGIDDEDRSNGNKMKTCQAFNCQTPVKRSILCHAHYEEHRYHNTHYDLITSIAYGPCYTGAGLEAGVSKALGTTPSGVSRREWKKLKEVTELGIRRRGWVK